MQPKVNSNGFKMQTQAKLNLQMNASAFAAAFVAATFVSRFLNFSVSDDFCRGGVKM